MQRQTTADPSAVAKALQIHRRKAVSVVEMMQRAVATPKVKVTPSEFQGQRRAKGSVTAASLSSAD